MEPLRACPEFDILRVLGEGAFGKVYQGQHRRSQDLVAIKQIKLGARSWEEVLKSTELQALKQLRNPFIVRLKEVVRSQWDGSLYFIFEFIESDLCRFLKKFPHGMEEMRVAVLAQQTLSGIAYMHQSSFFHRDMKPENILYCPTSETVRICDFGQARSLRARPPFTDYVGTRWYRAPECLLQDKTYSSPVDIWACGLIFAELLKGAPLYMGTSSIDQLYKIFAVQGAPTESSWPEFVRLAQQSRFRAAPQQGGCGLQRVLPRTSLTWMAALEELCMINPRRRPPAKRCLDFEIFASLPSLDVDASRRMNSQNSILVEDEPTPDPESSELVKEPFEEVTPPPSKSGPAEQRSSGPAVDVDLDLDAELDAILGDSPKLVKKKLELSEDSPKRPSPSLSQSFNFAPSLRASNDFGKTVGSSFSGLGNISGIGNTDSPTKPVMKSPEKNKTLESPAAGKAVGDLLDDLCADLGLDTIVEGSSARGPGSNQDGRAVKPDNAGPSSAGATEKSSSGKVGPEAATIADRHGSKDSTQARHGSKDSTQSTGRAPSDCADQQPGAKPDDGTLGGASSSKAAGRQNMGSRPEPGSKTGFGFAHETEEPLDLQTRPTWQDLTSDESDEEEVGVKEAISAGVKLSATGSCAMAATLQRSAALRQATSTETTERSAASESQVAHGETCLEPIVDDGTDTSANADSELATSSAQPGRGAPAVDVNEITELGAFSDGNEKAEALQDGDPRLQERDTEHVMEADLARLQELKAEKERLLQRVKAKSKDWTEEELTQLRRAVRRVIRSGEKDKTVLWRTVADELGNGRGPRECKLQYAKAYKAHREANPVVDVGDSLVQTDEI